MGPLTALSGDTSSGLTGRMSFQEIPYKDRSANTTVLSLDEQSLLKASALAKKNSYRKHGLSGAKEIWRLAWKRLILGPHRGSFDSLFRSMRLSQGHSRVGFVRNMQLKPQRSSTGRHGVYGWFRKSDG